MDALRLRGARFEVRLGVGAQERARPQPVELDVELWVPLEAAGKSDDLAKGLDYAAVFEAVKGAIDGKEFRLLEAVAERAAAVAMGFGARAVVARARKLAPPVKGSLAAFEVEVRRPTAPST